MKFLVIFICKSRSPTTCDRASTSLRQLEASLASSVSPWTSLSQVFQTMAQQGQAAGELENLRGLMEVSKQVGEGLFNSTIETFEVEY